MKVVAFNGSARRGRNTAILLGHVMDELRAEGIETELVELSGARILLGSPAYVTDVSPEIKALIDRACMVSGANGGMFRRKAGAGVVAVRRGGATHDFDALNHFFLITEMIVPGSCYWNIGIGREIGEVEKDEEGIRTMQVPGRNMAWLLKKLSAADDRQTVSAAQPAAAPSR